MRPWSRKCLSVVLKYTKTSTGSVKTKKLCVSWKMLKIEFKFLRLAKSIVFKCLPLISDVLSMNKRKYGPEKPLYLDTFHEVSEPTKRLAAQSTEYALCNRQGKQAFVKENENEKTKQKKKKKKKSKYVKSLRYMD